MARQYNKFSRVLIYLYPAGWLAISTDSGDPHAANRLHSSIEILLFSIIHRLQFCAFSSLFIFRFLVYFFRLHHLFTLARRFLEVKDHFFGILKLFYIVCFERFQLFLLLKKMEELNEFFQLLTNLLHTDTEFRQKAEVNQNLC